jgi:hypothetical protein
MLAAPAAGANDDLEIVLSDLRPTQDPIDPSRAGELLEVLLDAQRDDALTGAWRAFVAFIDRPVHGIDVDDGDMLQFRAHKLTVPDEIRRERSLPAAGLYSVSFIRQLFLVDDEGAYADMTSVRIDVDYVAADAGAEAVECHIWGRGAGPPSSGTGSARVPDKGPQSFVAEVERSGVLSALAGHQPLRVGVS